MAQHDYVIANQSGSAFRADLNNALAASVSTNSGSSAPSTTYAYMLWADTTNGVLKIRNSANNSWIELLQLDGTLTMEDGAEATPGLAFRDDLNTGIWSSAADKFNISTGGTERLELGTTTVFNDGGADVDFRIEGDTNANLFYVDAGTEQIGIRATPDRILTIDSSALDAFGDPDDPSDYAIVIRKNDTTNAGNGICFTNEDGSSVGGAIIHQDKGSYGIGDLTFWTSAANNTPIEKLRIESSGNVKINDGDLVIGTSGHGIDFSATADGGASTPNELLDDYEEGTWTPANSNLAITNNVTASYTKVGRLVVVQFDITYSTSNADTSPTGGVINGLPYQPDDSFHFTPTFLNSAGNAIGDNESYGFISYVEASSNNRIIFHSLAQGATATRELMAGVRVRATVTYFST